MPAPGLRRLDHVGIAVRNTEIALEYFSGILGLKVVHTEERASPPVRLTYLDTGNAYLQLVEPLSDDSAVSSFLREHGEGMHHVCFGVDGVGAVAGSLSQNDDPPTIGGGRGRASAFVPGPTPHGMLVECTEFFHQDDVVASRGWLPDGPTD